MAVTRSAILAVLALTAAAAAASPARAAKPTAPPPAPDPQILYDATSGRNTGIWEMNADGTNVTFVFAGGDSGTWSPDGTRMALNWNNPELGLGNTYRIDADGTDPVLLDPDGAGRSSWSPAPAGSPTHDLVAYHSYTDNSLMVTSVTGGAPQLVLQGDRGGTPYCDYEMPEWSPDGDVLVVGAWCKAGVWPGYNALIVAPPLAPQDRYVLLANVSAWRPSWARQHDWLAVTASVGGVYGTYVLQLTRDLSSGRYAVASGPTLIAQGAKNAVWSPDDTKLVYEAPLPKNRGTGLFTHVLATGARTLVGSGANPDWRR